MDENFSIYKNLKNKLINNLVEKRNNRRYNSNFRKIKIMIKRSAEGNNGKTRNTLITHCMIAVINSFLLSSI